MVSDSDPRTPDSPSDDDAKRPVISTVTTPINTRSHALHRFNGEYWSTNDFYSSLAEEMSPYFVGPMLSSDFLDEFLPRALTQVDPPFTEGMFNSVITSKDEVQMYDPFVCP